MEKIVKVSTGKEFTVKEIKYKEFIEHATQDKRQVALFLFKTSAGVTEEEFDSMSMKDGISIQKAIDEVNGFTEAFQKPQPQEILQ
ncbi:MAG: hypothetical protein ACFFDS_07980 [Candidatus Thorarchaeota archaeon]